MALFEGYERKIDKINKALAEYGISSLEEAEKITKDAGLNVYDMVKGIQPICFEDACWAYIAGAAIAIKTDCRRAADAAAAIGVGLQAFCLPGSVAEQRKVGLGLPLLKLAAEQTGGTLKIESVSRNASKEHCGTTVEAFFHTDHMDFTPIGDIISTITLLIQGNPGIDFRFLHEMPDRKVELDTRELRAVLGDDVPLNDFAVLNWITESLQEQYNS